jgi:hypothetical protein
MRAPNAGLILIALMTPACNGGGDAEKFSGTAEKAAKARRGQVLAAPASQFEERIFQRLASHGSRPSKALKSILTNTLALTLGATPWRCPR